MNSEPDISQLKEQGNIGKLIKLLGHKDAAVKRAAAAALVEIPKAQGNNKVIQALEKQMAKESGKKVGGYTIPTDHRTLLTLKHAYCVAKQAGEIEYLAIMKNAWSDAYLDFLRDHYGMHKGVFQLGLDRDRARKAWGEQLAKQTIALTKKHVELCYPPKRMIDMVFLLGIHLQFLEDLLGIAGSKYLQMPPNDPGGHHDWDLSRYVFHEYFGITERMVGVKFALDFYKLKKFVDKFKGGIIMDLQRIEMGFDNAFMVKLGS